jgi:heme exporter protein A
LIRAEQLSVAFGRTIALDSLEVTMGPGVVGLFGPNGSGKSTLLRVVAGLLAPTRGSVTFNGMAVSASDESFRRLVGYVGHSAGLYGRLTVAENLSLFATLHGRPAARVLEVAEQTALTDHLLTPAGSLSTGLSRRAAVARALLSDPELLLLDEPYANLDDEAAESVSQAIRAWRAPGRTAIVATHGAKKLKGWADAGVILRQGHIVTAGSYRAPTRSRAGTPT